MGVEARLKREKGKRGKEKCQQTREYSPNEGRTKASVESDRFDDLFILR